MSSPYPLIVARETMLSTGLLYLTNHFSLPNHKAPIKVLTSTWMSGALRVHNHRTWTSSLWVQGDSCVSTVASVADRLFSKPHSDRFVSKIHRWILFQSLESKMHMEIWHMQSGLDCLVLLHCSVLQCTVGSRRQFSAHGHRPVSVAGRSLLKTP